MHNVPKKIIRSRLIDPIKCIKQPIYATIYSHSSQNNQCYFLSIYILILSILKLIILSNLLRLIRIYTKKN